MSLIKKIVAIATVFSVLTFVSPVFGATVEELQAQINLLQATLSQLQAQLAALQGQPTVTGCTITSFDRNLKQGMSGDDVKCLQIILNSATDTQVATTGAGSPGSETTYFGPLTFEAVKKFQEKHRSEILDPIAPGFAPTGYVGAKTRAKLNTLIGVTPPTAGCTTDADCAAGYMCSAGTCVVKPAVVPMSVAVSADTPVAANVWKGSANNVVTKLTFYGGSTASTITGLTLTNYGTTEATGSTDLSAVKIFDEFNVQQGTDKTVAGNKVVFVFVPSITLPANGTETLSVAVNVGSGAGTLEMVKLGLAAATDITGATFTGTFPMAGNSFTIVPAGSIGSVTVAQFGSLPVTTVRVGQKDVVLEKFTVSAGSNEDIAINQITIKNDATATISDSDITNIRVREVGGAVIAGPGNLSSKKVTLNLATPYPITKGTSKNFEVIADIVSGATSSTTRTVKLYLDTGAVVAQGKLSGVNMTSTGTTTADAVTINIGAVSVSMSTAHPQGAAAYIIQTTNMKTLAVFSVKATGEAQTFSAITATLDSTADLSDTNYLSNVGLYVDGGLISDQLTVDDDGTQTWAVNWTLSADTTKDVYIMGQTSTLGSNASYSIVPTWTGFTSVGLSSGETTTDTTSVVATAIVVYASGKLTVSADTTKTPYNQGILAPSNGVILGALKVYAQREDQRLTDLVVTVTGSSLDAGDISSLTLYDSAGTTQLSNPITYSGYTYTFGTSDFINPIIFTNGQYKTILLKANFASGADGASNIYAYLANTTGQLKTEGVDSATAYDYNTDTSGLNFYFTSPFAGGKFSSGVTLGEMVKDSTSPSGSVSRGSFVTYAIFDVTNRSSDQSAVAITAITFTSKTGLPSTLEDTTDAALFALYDGDGNLIRAGSASSDTLTKASGTIAFTSFDNAFSVAAGETKQLILEITTTNTTKWPSNTQMQWGVAAVGDATVTSGVLGFGGSVYSIPAFANIVTLP